MSESVYEVWVCLHCNATYIIKYEVSSIALGDHLGVWSGGMIAINEILVCCDTPNLEDIVTKIVLSDEWISQDEKKDRMEFLGGWNIL